MRSWITRPDDPGFWERAADICGLYLVPPTNALVLSVDEKTGMPARSRTRPTTRPAPGRPSRQDTSTSAMAPPPCWPRWTSTAAGSVQATDLDRNTAANFIEFLDDLDVKVPAGWQVHLVLDNGSSHIACDTREVAWPGLAASLVHLGGDVPPTPPRARPPALGTAGSR